MNSRLVLVTGGCRSGKSSFALSRAEREGRGGVFIATSPIIDAETEYRVQRHREERRGRGWETREEEIDIARAVAESPPEAVVLVDCLTLWVNNLLYRAEKQGEDAPSEDMVAVWTGEFTAACRSRSGLTVVVTNEVGLGIVPDTVLARRFRDLTGRANQATAAAADEVYLLVAGIPIRMK